MRGPTLPRMPRKVLVLGSTGSIGEQALEVIAGSAELEVAGLAASRSWERLCQQALRHGATRVALEDADAAGHAGAELATRCRVLAGEEGIRELVRVCEPDVVLNAIVGFAGLGPTIVALTQGCDVALANKESLVAGGKLVTALAEATGARLIPVDSEHSALMQLIAKEPPGTVERLVLTASGGPFREVEDLSGVTPQQALAHPTWEMGGRITVDSATLMNKGFELIEAHHLFGFEYRRIEVVVHPQSIVHALVHLNDGMALAHAGNPDMRAPISYSLHYPERADAPVEPLDLAAVGRLDFAPPDPERFPALRLAREAGEQGGVAPCVLNAADEVAVEAFLAGETPFTAIPETVEAVLDAVPPLQPTHFDDLIAVDAEARALAGEQIRRLAGVGR
jgi:1-deoxy-D-xylulose-5-phosphate reductoisomerase